MNRIKLLILGGAAIVPAATVMLTSAVSPNLVANGEFSNNVNGWENFSGNPTWFKKTMKVTNDYQGTGNSYYSGWYCVKNIQAGTKYETKADYMVPESAPEHSGASLQLHYYAADDCGGGNMPVGGARQAGGYKAEQRGAWLTFSFKEVAPAGAHSVRVRATAEKEPKPNNTSIPETFSVYFDNVSFREAALDIVAPSPSPDPTKAPDDVVANPTPVAPNPTPVPPSEPANTGAEDEGVSAHETSQPLESTPAAEDRGAQGNGGSKPEVTHEAPTPTATPAAPDTGETQKNDGNSMNLALAAMASGAGLLLLGVAFKLRRRDEE